VFFDALGIKWWYEPEGFSLRFNYEEFAAYWDLPEDELLAEGIPQTFQHLDGKEYTYLPDFYLPELNFWVEIKGPNPTRDEVEKAFILSYMAYSAARKQIDEAKTEAELSRAFEALYQLGVYIVYGDIPWPFPQKGHILGYGKMADYGSTFFEKLASSETRLVSAEWRLARAESVAEESPRKETEYRRLLKGQLKLCWQECPLCLKIGIGEIGSPYCRSCHDQIANHIWVHLAGYRVMSDREPRLDRNAAYPANVKAMKLTKDLINPEFFASGHKTPKLQEAYNAARSARFEHGQSP
jgi:hypothetical protein